MVPASLVAGLLSGVTGLIVFLIIHHLWIRPIWFILPAGLLIAAVGGLSVGWSYLEIKAGLPPRPWTALAVFALVGAMLTPAVLAGQLRQPLLDIRSGAILGSRSATVARFVVELLFTAGLVGGLAGWWLGGTGRAAFTTALAGLVFALGPGHNIPLLGSTPGAGKGAAILIATILVSALVLVESEAWLARSFPAK